MWYCKYSTIHDLEKTRHERHELLFVQHEIFLYLYAFEILGFELQLYVATVLCCTAPWAVLV